MNAVTFVVKNVFYTYRFNTIIQYGCSSELTKCLEYAQKKINFFLRDMNRDNQL